MPKFKAVLQTTVQLFDERLTGLYRQYVEPQMSLREIGDADEMLVMLAVGPVRGAAAYDWVYFNRVAGTEHHLLIQTAVFSPDELHVIMLCEDDCPRLGELFDQLLQWVQGYFRLSAREALPKIPPKPGENGWTWSDLFDWWYRGGKVYCPERKNLALALDRTPKTVGNNHALYKEEFGAAPMPDARSKFAGHKLGQ